MSRRFSPSDRLSSFRFALRGLRSLLAEEHNARIHLAATVAVVGLGFAVGLNSNEWRWIMLAAGLVWLAEAFNTATERLGDAITADHHPQIGLAKDVAASGVLIGSLVSAAIGISIFGPHLIEWLAW